MLLVIKAQQQYLQTSYDKLTFILKLGLFIYIMLTYNAIIPVGKCAPLK